MGQQVEEHNLFPFTTCNAEKTEWSRTPMVLSFITSVSILWMFTFEPGISEIVKLGNKTYDVSYMYNEDYIGRRLELICQLKGPKISWYYKDPYNIPAGYNHMHEKDCLIGEHACNLVLRKLKKSDAGHYICADGVNANGSNVEVRECKWPKIKALPFYNQTVSEGDNVSFICEADIGLVKCPMFILKLSFHQTIKKNGVDVHLSSIVTQEAISRTLEGHQIGGLKMTIYKVTAEFFGSEVSIVLEDFETGQNCTCKSYLLQKKGGKKIEKNVTVGIVVLVVVILVITIGVCCSILNYPFLHYYFLLWKCSGHGLPDIEGKEFHGLLLYNELENSYSKVQKLKKNLSQYQLQEFPPGHDSAEQQAGFERFQLLDRMCQVSACVIIVGEVGDVEERCLSSFQGRHVTHILLGKSLTHEKKINPVQWPDDSGCLRSVRWRNFVYRVRKNLPRVSDGAVNNHKEQMLTQRII